MAVVIKVGETEAVSVDIGEKVYIQGDPGFSPTIEVTDITGGHRLTITDINGDKTVDVMNGAKGDTGDTGNGIDYITLNADYTLTVRYTNGTSWTSESIRGEKGDKGDTGDTGPTGPQGQPGQTGATPDISIGTVITGAAGSQASATMTGTAENPVLNLTIPKGDPGEVTQTEFDELADEVSQQKSAIDDLSALVDRKAGMLVDSVSGAVASFVPDSTIPNLLGVSVDIEPVQDLHGYDSPWPGGGGKNKFDVDKIEYYRNPGNGSECINNGDGTISVYATSSTNIECGKLLREIADLEVGEAYILSAESTGTNKFIYLHGAALQWGFGGTKTITQEMLDGRVSFYASGINSSANISNIMIRLASVTDATYAPYENLCPISGWDAVTVGADGVNLFDKSTGIQLTSNNILVARNAGYGVPFKFKKNVVYTISCNSATRPNAINIIRPYTPTSIISNSNSYSITFTPTEDTEAGINFYWIGDRPADATDIQIEPGSTATAYHPYSGNRYVIQLGQTVYGAKLTIAEDGSVNALVDRAAVTIDSSTAIYGNPAKAYTQINAMLRLADYSGNIYCDKLATAANSNVTVDALCITGYPKDSSYPGENWIYFLAPSGMFPTLNDLKAWISANPLQVVYPLATPIVIQLDPVTISTISGQTNNVWAAGDVTVEYAADLKHYIDSKIAAAVAALS